MLKCFILICILEKNFSQVFAFIETCLFETSCLFILSSCKTQTLNNINNEDLLTLSEDTNDKSNAKETLEIIGEIVLTIKYFICKSNSLFEKVFTFFIDILINEINVSNISGNENQRLSSINGGHVVEFLKCFDLTRASYVIKTFLEVIVYFNLKVKCLKFVSNSCLKRIQRDLQLIASHSSSFFQI